MTVFLSATNPGGGAEELSANPVFLIKGPPDETGRVIYYITRALERYAVPTPDEDDGSQTIAEYFDNQSAGNVFHAARIDTTLELFEPLAQTDLPPS